MILSVWSLLFVSRQFASFRLKLSDVMQLLCMPFISLSSVFELFDFLSTIVEKAHTFIEPSECPETRKVSHGDTSSAKHPVDA